MNKIRYCKILLIMILVFLLYKYFKYESFDNYNEIKIAIVTTVRNPHNFNDWLKYHFKFGVYKVFAIFDDPNEDISIYKNYDNKLQIILNDSNWKEKLKKCKQYNSHINSLDKEVMSRQILNAELVLSIAKVEMIDWLIHIDADEILYSNKYNNISQSFSNLNNLTNIVKLSNYELAPIENNSNNCFKTHTYFKTKKAGTLFKAYYNGKGACKVSSDSYPFGVHDFKNSKSEVKETFNESDLVILHYVNCSFNEWIKKYKLLGKFSDKWWNRRFIPLKFHRESRDIVTNNNIKFWENTAKQLYNKEMIIDKNMIDSLMSQNKIMKIDKIKDYLN
jgi:hypothetical protein